MPPSPMPDHRTPEQVAAEKTKVRRVLGTICLAIAAVPCTIGGTLLYRTFLPEHAVQSPQDLRDIPDHHWVQLEGNHIVAETAIVEAVIGSGPTTYVSVFEDAPDVALHGSSPKPDTYGRMLPGDLPRLGGHLEEYVFEDYAASLNQDHTQMRVLETGGSKTGMRIEASAGIVCTGLPFLAMAAFVAIKLR